MQLINAFLLRPAATDIGVFTTSGAFRVQAFTLAGSLVGRWSIGLSLPIYIDVRADRPELTIQAQGVFSDSVSEMEMLGAKLGELARRYELAFDGGERARGQFKITELRGLAERNGERTYQLGLESEGRVEL